MFSTFEKRTWEETTLTIDCSPLLADSETITGTPTMVCDEASISFGTAVVNTDAVVMPDGVSVPAGKVIQVKVIGGVVPTPNTKVLSYIRARFLTNPGGGKGEATVPLKLTDFPI